MTLKANWFQTNVSPLVDARDERRLLRGLGPVGGVLMPGDLAVSVVGAGTTLNVNVAACSQGGGAIIPGLDTHQGSYFAYNDAAIQVPIAVADPTNPRIDTMVLRIYDDEPVPGSGFAVSVEAVRGAPNANPVAPVLPRDCIPLADVRVNANATGIVAGNITDRRRKDGVGLPWNSPWGMLAFAQNAADQVINSNNETMICDIASFLFRAGRHYEVYGSLGSNSSLNTNRILARLLNVTDGLRVNLVDTGSQGSFTGMSRYAAPYIMRPTVDVTKRFQLTAQMASGTGTITISGTDPQKAILGIYDMGPQLGAMPSSTREELEALNAQAVTLPTPEPAPVE